MFTFLVNAKAKQEKYSFAMVSVEISDSVRSVVRIRSSDTMFSVSVHLAYILTMQDWKIAERSGRSAAL